MVYFTFLYFLHVDFKISVAYLGKYFLCMWNSRSKKDLV